MPPYLATGTTGPLVRFEKRDSWAVYAVWKSMWNGVVKVTVVPLTDWTSITWPTGRSGRVNQVRDTSPGGDLVLHSVIAGLVTWSTTTISPAVNPGFEVSTAVWLPFTASLARFLDCVNLNQCVPTTMGVELVPT